LISAETKTENSAVPQTARTIDQVSVVIPCFNEERFIGKALESLAGQYDNEHYEILVIDGLSDDRTREVIAEFAQTRPQLPVKVVDNPKRSIPAALNLGVQHASSEIIARMDAHAAPSDGYIRGCVAALKQTNVGVVGMPCHVRPGENSLLARAIAAAVSHPFGIGDAKYRLAAGTAAQEPDDTVAFACFRKSLWQELGGFNEELLANEDYDFNYRVRASGYLVLLDRSGHCDYFARTTLVDLARQYWRYGGWKAEMVKLHPRSIRIRHMVAPLFLLSVAALVVTGFFWPWAWGALALELGFYLGMALASGWKISRREHGGWAMVLLMPVVFFTIHATWGTSFLGGLIKSKRKS
jgi:glycosyltransferase involved in cell wall biosynthesis